jgi:hypothetical protein
LEFENEEKTNSKAFKKSWDEIETEIGDLMGQHAEEGSEQGQAVWREEENHRPKCQQH